MIPLSVPNLCGNEWKYIKECLDTNWVSSVGSYVDLFEKKVSEFTGAKYAISVVNGTCALHLSLQLAGVKSGDLVIVPNITFVASANSVKHSGADPVFIDVEESTWQMDLDLLEDFLQNRCQSKSGQTFFQERSISAIMPVHVLGNLCDMDRLLAIADRFHLAIVEDATEALGSYYRNKHAGTFGLCGCLSFNGNKIITTGGGGMIITNDEAFAKKAKHLSTQAKSNPHEYEHDEIGYNYRLVNLLAAMGVAQMELLPDFLERKKQIAEYYRKHLEDIPGIAFQHVPAQVASNHWLFTVRHPKSKELSAFLNKNEIQSRPLWVPMNRLKMYRNNYFHTESDHSAKLYESCISLPSSTGLSNREIELVTKKIIEFLKG